MSSNAKKRASVKTIYEYLVVHVGLCIFSSRIPGLIETGGISSTSETYIYIVRLYGRLPFCFSCGWHDHTTSAILYQVYTFYHVANRIITCCIKITSFTSETAVTTHCTAENVPRFFPGLLRLRMEGNGRKWKQFSQGVVRLSVVGRRPLEITIYSCRAAVYL